MERNPLNKKGRIFIKHKFYYGSAPKFTKEDKKSFSRKGYECKALLRDRRGGPVAILQNTDPKFPICKVEYGFSCVVFASYDDALAFCKDRFGEQEVI